MSLRRPWEGNPIRFMRAQHASPRDPRQSRLGHQSGSARSATQQVGDQGGLREAIRTFRLTHDLVDLLEERLGEGALKRVASTNGGEWAGPCPLCGGDDRLRVWPSSPAGPPWAWCRQCRASGDVLYWFMRIRGVDASIRGATATTLRDLGLL